MTPHIASWEIIRDIRQTGAKAVVWPDEGEFRNGVWRFNKAHFGFEPLIIDLMTSTVMCATHDALSESRQAKYRDWVEEDRGSFGAAFEWSWKVAKPTPYHRR